MQFMHLIHAYMRTRSQNQIHTNLISSPKSKLMLI